MKFKLLLLIALTVQVTMASAQGLTTSNQGFRNPVLPGFHADPSVCRAGDDFYLVNSTFQYFPGVPVVNGNGTLTTDMHCPTLPQVPMPLDPVREEFNYVKRDVPADSYSTIGLPWGWHSIGNPDYSRYSLTERMGWLRLKPTTTTLDKAASPTFVARRQTEKVFTATTLLDASHIGEGMQAGITAYAAPLNHYDVIVEKRDGKLYAKSNIRIGELAHCDKEVPLNSMKVYLRITSDAAYYYMQVSDDGKSFQTLGKMDFRYVSTEVIGGFTGVMLGVFAQCTSPDNMYADFDWFEMHRR